MVKVKKILTSIERNKNKIAKFLIICAVLKFFTSTLYRIYSSIDSRTLIETTINIYSLIFVGLIFIQEFVQCFLCKSITENLKIITHFQGKGIVFILISIIYMSHSLGPQQNYSAYLLFSCGILLIAADCKFVEGEDEVTFNKVYKRNEIHNENEFTQPGNINEFSGDKLEIPVKVITNNPYDIPEDF